MKRELRNEDIGKEFQLADGTRCKLCADPDGWYVTITRMAFWFRSRSVEKSFWTMNLYDIQPEGDPKGWPVGMQEAVG